MRLLAEKVVELEYIDSISHTEIGRILKKRTQTSLEAILVHRQDQQSLFSGNGAYSLVVCTTL